MLDMDMIRNTYGPPATSTTKIPFGFQAKIFIAYRKNLGKENIPSRYFHIRELSCAQTLACEIIKCPDNVIIIQCCYFPLGMPNN